MRVRFVRDYRGAATGETFYPAGSIADLPNGAAIVAEGAAVPEPDSAPAPAAGRPPRKRGG